MKALEVNVSWVSCCDLDLCQCCRTQGNLADKMWNSPHPNDSTLLFSVSIHPKRSIWKCY